MVRAHFGDLRPTWEANKRDDREGPVNDCSAPRVRNYGRRQAAVRAYSRSNRFSCRIDTNAFCAACRPTVRRLYSEIAVL